MCLMWHPYNISCLYLISIPDLLSFSGWNSVWENGSGFSFMMVSLCDFSHLYIMFSHIRFLYVLWVISLYWCVFLDDSGLAEFFSFWLHSFFFYDRIQKFVIDQLYIPTVSTKPLFAICNNHLLHAYLYMYVVYAFVGDGGKMVSREINLLNFSTGIFVYFIKAYVYFLSYDDSLCMRWIGWLLIELWEILYDYVSILFMHEWLSFECIEGPKS